MELGSWALISPPIYLGFASPARLYCSRSARG